MNAPVLTFRSAQACREWFRRHHAASNGIWLRIFKKSSGRPTVGYDDALEEALCVGWIDGQKKVFDAASWVQKFTPRRANSLWSKKNRDRVTRLSKEGRMTPAGIAEVERAKADGRWERAYDSPSNMDVPTDFLSALARNKKAEAFFRTLNRANTYAIAWRLQTAKTPETREKRMRVLLAMMANGEKLH